MLKEPGDSWSWWKSDKFSHAIGSEPDMVIIKLGTNDAKTGYDSRRSNFKKDAIAMVDTFTNLASNPKVFLARPIAAGSNGFRISPSNISTQIIPAIDSIVQEKNLTAIDLYSPFVSQVGSLTYDNVHPNNAGMDTIAKHIYNVVKDIKINKDPVVGLHISNEKDNSNMSVYPTISDGKIKVEINEKAVYTLSTLDGKSIIKGKLSSGLNELAFYHKGLVILQIDLPNQTKTFRVIVN